ncbi:Latrophilin receptor-like protein A [Hondaea fermentalgiana]|uniref:Latrophilin receptor-like protein A n=1 Tax=Hondaea fermentalgiana TaxID=2315210 RepID=A0A2R5H1B3_9STRA|nr:Latrophilin receptor-like protein A [Hondaea fermentalgiana]|eukprot:GBG34124.1 Latrophilin receptor-like protein A [Hondaea fermentalgiana]
MRDEGGRNLAALALALALTQASGWRLLESDTAEATSDLCASVFDEAQTQVLRTVTLTGAGLSLAGSLFIVISYLILVRIRTFPYKLVMFLSVANVGSSLAYFVGLASINEGNVHECTSSVGCILAAAMTQFFDVASFFWIAIIAFNVHAVLVRNKGRAVEAYERWYHLVGWGISLIITIICGALGCFGDSGIWCWIKRDRQTARFFAYYLPLLIVFSFTASTYLIVSSALQHQVQGRTVTRRLRLYLAVFVVFRVWGVVHRTHNYFHENQMFWLALMHAIFSPLQGFANALVYGCNAAVAREYRRYCSGLNTEDRIEDGDDDLDDDDVREVRAQELTPI